MFPTLAPEATFSGALHFRVLARALERVASGETRRLMIAIPPRHGKSLFASVAFPAWILGRDPTRKVICASYGDQLSMDFSNRFRDLMWSADYQAPFPDAGIAPNGSSLSEVRLTSKGYRLATTVQGPATGKGAHLIIVDDPFKAAEAASDAVRNSVYDWFKGSPMTRFDKLLSAVMAQPRVKRLLSSDHFSVDGTLIEAWASMKTFRPRDGSDDPPPSGGGGNREADFHGQKRSNETHASTTDSEARLWVLSAGRKRRTALST